MDSHDWRTIQSVELRTFVGPGAPLSQADAEVMLADWMLNWRVCARCERLAEFDETGKPHNPENGNTICDDDVPLSCDEEIVKKILRS
jgi:hypothetical protein